MSGQVIGAPPCANTTGWFCRAYFTPYNTMELFVTVLSIGACAYILTVTMMMRTHDLFTYFTLHLYIPFVPYYAISSTKMLCKYTAYFGIPVLSLARDSWLQSAAVYFGCINQIQYQTLISAVMTVLILGIWSPVTFKRFMTGRNLVYEFVVCHILVNSVAVISTLCSIGLTVDGSPLINTLVDTAFFVMNGAFVVTGVATIVTFLMALMVVIAYRRKHGSSPGKNSVGSATQLLTLLVYSIPPTISSFFNSVISLDGIMNRLLPSSTIVVVSEIYIFASRIERICLLMRVIILTITTIVSFHQYRLMTIQLLTCSRKPKRTLVQTVIVTTRTALPPRMSHR